MSGKRSAKDKGTQRDPAAVVERGGRNDEPVSFDELGRDTQLLAVIRIISQADPPLVIGVHGDWGEGKTSFMRVVKSLLGAETRFKYLEEELKAGVDGEPLADRVERLLTGPRSKSETGDILSVWFNPWEHQFEDEPVIPLLHAIRQQQASGWGRIKSNLKRVTEDPKFRIIAKSALGVATMVGPEWLSAMTRNARKMARAVTESFTQFRDEFERCMEQLTAKSGGRLVVFVDDLDRCEAPYVVKILEALKLHLLNKYCVFVLGCADVRVRECLKEQMEVSEQAATEYLEKIVQLPVHLPPVWDQNFKRLLDHLKCERLGKGDCFGLLRAFAGHNPRRLKRFLYWYEMERGMVQQVPGLKEEVGGFYTNEAMFLKVKLLQFVDPHGFRVAADFNEDVPPPSKPSELEEEGGRVNAIRSRPPHIGVVLDEDKGKALCLRLMLALTTNSTEATDYEKEAHLRGKAESVEVVEDAVRRALNKPIGEAADVELASITKLNLSGTNLRDLAPLGAMIGLRELSLRRTQVSDLTPLERLMELEELNLAGTRLRNLEPLENLRALRRLVLRRTRVSNLDPLRGLKKLEHLNLADTRVIDVEALAELTELKELSLRGTKLETVKPLSKLKKLKTLDLVGTQVKDKALLQDIEGLTIVGP